MKDDEGTVRSVRIYILWSTGIGLNPGSGRMTNLGGVVPGVRKDDLPGWCCTWGSERMTYLGGVVPGVLRG